MTTIRQAHHKKYVSITNKLAQNNDLSLRARGLMLYFLSLPDDWKILLPHLHKVMKEGERVIDNTLMELKRAGYIHHHKMGFKEGWQYFVFEEPMTQDEFKIFLRTTAVCEEFEKANCSNLGPPLLSTHKNTKSSSTSPNGDIEEDEPNRTERKESDRIGSNGSPSSSEEKEKKYPSLEEVEMVIEHAHQRSEGKIRLKHGDIRLWTMKYGLEKTIQAVEMAIEDMKSGSLLTNPAGWITNALKNGY